ncbi:Pycsar system effector family protein [Flagellimonas beolgyonensis]|uniref:Pycsar system effector family protein n=1 Tax=Flagellimonas beolgyonensis TaxID=864064 RepID=UPI000F8EBA57|nr:Pycsar system effector family protein [Allomuricauda beolgyonensis]
MKNTESISEKTSSKNQRMDKLKKYDSRGVQTLFRTLSRNHYNLLKMVDNKARIMLTVNSIISSLLLGALVLVPANGEFTITIGTRILVICSLFSMIFAIFSMLPHRYIGKEFRASNYKGTLYADNFANQSLVEFKEELNRIMESGQNTYDEMVVDLYFLGKAIAKKQRLLLISSGILLIGIIATIAYSLITGTVILN